MLASMFAYDWDYWELGHKVTFDGLERTITVNPDVTEIDIKIDVYSDWKEWVRLQSNLRYTPAIRAIGGDATSGGQTAGDIYFLRNNWLLVIDLTQTRLTGVIFSDDYDSPLRGFDGSPVFQSLVSSLVTGVSTTENIITGDIQEVVDDVASLTTDVANVSTDIANVSTQVSAVSTTTDSIYSYMTSKLLTLQKFIGLK